MINFVIILTKMTNFWNVSSALAPIHITATSVKDTHPPMVTLPGLKATRINVVMYIPTGGTLVKIQLPIK